MDYWQNKRVLVAGGAGMIGSHLARRLVELGADVEIADNLSSGSIKNIRDLLEKVDFLEFDLRDFISCLRATAGVDYAFQLSADMGGIGYITAVGADIMRNSVLINVNMLEACHKNHVPNFFFSSSACVYPEYLQNSEKVEPLRESDAYPAQPDQFYGWEKLLTEKLCEAYSRDYGMNIRVARFHNVYGEAYTAFDKIKGKAPAHMVLKAIKADEKFIVWGSGKQTRSFLYIDDCIDGILKLAESDVKQPLNIGTDRLVSINELARIVIEISGKSFKIEHDLTKPQGVRGRNADLTLVKKLIGWEPKISLEEGLKRIYDWAVQRYSELEGIE